MNIHRETMDIYIYIYIYIYVYYIGNINEN